MIILSYIGYSILVIFALTWALGVRYKFSLVSNLIIVSLYYVTACIYLPMSDLSLNHSWWIIPSGFLLGFILFPFMSIPFFSHLIRLVASVYAGILRIGIPASEIARIRDKENWDTVNKYFDSKKSEKQNGA